MQIKLMEMGLQREWLQENTGLYICLIAQTWTHPVQDIKLLWLIKRRCVAEYWNENILLMHQDMEEELQVENPYLKG